MHTYMDGLSGSVAREGWSGSTPESTCSCPCEMFSSAGGAAAAETSPEHADRSAATRARTDGCGRLTTRRLAMGKAEMGSDAGSTSASRSLSSAGSSDAAASSSAWTAASSSSLAAAESESSEWSAAAAVEVEGLDGDASGLRFRLRHLRRESGRS